MIEGNEWSRLRQAYEYWEALTVDDELKESAMLVTLAFLEAYNDSCVDSEDEITSAELEWLFGEE